MFAARWQKVWNDLRLNMVRTVLIILSITVGLFAVGTITGSQSILRDEMARSFTAILPSNGTLRTVQLFDEDFVRSIASLDRVAEVQARYSVPARVQLASGKWLDITIFAVPDYDHMQVNKIRPESGAWPPPDRQVLIERNALPLIEAQAGDSLVFEFPNHQQRRLEIAGTVHDLIQLPAQIDSTPYGYVSMETIQWFGEPYGFNELHIIVSGAPSKADAEAVIGLVKTRAEKSGFLIPISLALEPGQLPLDDILQAVLFLLGSLGLLSIFLSAFLIVNTVSALLTQQKRQIAVMKAVGASTIQIFVMYEVMVAVYGVAALFISIPLSLIGMRVLASFLAAMFNFDLIDMQLPSLAWQLQCLVGLGLPVLASLFPLFGSLRRSVAEGMSAFQPGPGSKHFDPINRLLGGMNFWFARFIILRPILLSLRNIFRNQGRLVLTLLTFSLASALFISVFNLRASLSNTVDELMRIYNCDILVSFERPYRLQRIHSSSTALPKVSQVSTWSQHPARYVRPDGSESGTIFLFALDPDSPLNKAPGIISGRWLATGDENALVVTSIFLKKEPDAKVGAVITLKLGGQESRWRIVGQVNGVMTPVMYASQAYTNRVTGDSSLGNVALISLKEHDFAAVNRAIGDLHSHYQKSGLRVSNFNATLTEREDAEATFSVIVSLLLFMAAILALVGGFGLMGTMSINVLERTREIGVLRAIGAPGASVAWVFIREGIAIGWLSWLFGALLAYPLTQSLAQAVGLALMGTPLAVSGSVSGLLLWFLLVSLLSILASYLPSKNASRMTVREVLAYE